MKTIHLTKGAVAVVDDCDYERLMEHKWSIHPLGYAKRCAKVNGKKCTILMHREILGLTPEDKIVVDHINRRKLDNQRHNLRECTQTQNCCNAGKRSHNTSGYKGVQWVAHANKWKAQITYNKKVKNLGYFETPELAHEFYCLAADMLHGEFANHGSRA